MSITIKDIARIAGVSYATVSKALSGSPVVKPTTKNKILRIAEELNYQPNIAAKSLISKKSNTIGLLWPSVERIAVSTLATKINEGLEANDYNMILSISPVESAIKLFNRIQVDGILAFDEGGPNNRLDAIPSTIPILRFGDAVQNHGSPFVDVDRRQAIFNAVQFLAKLGHRRITYIGDLHGKKNQQEKYLGFIDGIIKLGLPTDPDMTIDTKGLHLQNAYVATKHLLKSSYRPTAIISGGYDLSIGIMLALKEANIRIPVDMSLVSYDNIPQMTNLEIPLTAVGAPIEKIAEKIVDVLLKLIHNNEPLPMKNFVDLELIERDSCCPPQSDQISVNT